MQLTAHLPPSCKVNGLNQPANVTNVREIRFGAIAIMLHLLAFAAICVVANRSVRGSDPAEAELIAEVKLRSDSGMSVLPARLFGEVENFLFDTGSTATIIDDGLRSKLGQPLGAGIVHASGGSFRVDVFKAPDLFLDSLRLNGRYVVCIDFGPINNVLQGDEFVGLIGMDRLAGYVIELDNAEGVVRFYDSVPESVKRTSECLELHHRGHYRFFVNATLPTIGEEPFLLDTGYNGSLRLRPDIFERIRRAGEIAACREIRSWAADGKYTTVHGVLRSFRLGRFQHGGLTVGKQISDEAVSLIGSDYLRRYVVVFDFPGERLYLRPSKYFNDPEEPLDKSGLVPVRRNGYTFIYLCRKNSPALEAGLRKNDQLLRVNDKSVEQFSLYQLRKLLKHEGEVVRMTIQRGEKTFEVKFRLREYRTFLPDPPVEAPIPR